MTSAKDGRIQALTLRPVAPHDWRFLFRWRGESERLREWNCARYCPTYEAFVDTFRERANRGDVLVVQSALDDHPCGLVHIVQSNLKSGWAFLSVYLEPEYENAEAFCQIFRMAGHQLLNRRGIHRIYCDVFETEPETRLGLLQVGAWEEGHIPDAYWFDGRYRGKWRLRYDLAPDPPASPNSARPAESAQPLRSGPALSNGVLFEGRYVAVRIRTNQDNSILFSWCRSPQDPHFLSSQEAVTDEDSFGAWLDEFEGVNGAVLVLLDIRDYSTIGYACAYSIDAWNKTMYIALYVIPPYRMRGHSIEAAFLIRDQLLSAVPVRRLYMEIQGSATRLLQHLRLAKARAYFTSPNFIRSRHQTTDLIVMGLDISMFRPPSESL